LKSEKSRQGKIDELVKLPDIKEIQEKVIKKHNLFKDNKFNPNITDSFYSYNLWAKVSKNPRSDAD